MGSRLTASVRNPAYTLYVCGAGLISLAIYCPLTFGVTYATANGFSPSLANYAQVSTGFHCAPC